MIGHQQAATGITGLKASLQPPGAAGAAGGDVSVNGTDKEMEDMGNGDKATGASAGIESNAQGEQDPSDPTVWTNRLSVTVSVIQLMAL